MSCLLYCIGREGLQPGAQRLPGVQGHPVSLVSESGLSAVVSQSDGPDSPPDVAMVLAYERVVEHFFRQATVLPMRYRCWLPSPAEVARLLRERCAEYDARLRQLDGFSEMGVQILGGGASRSAPSALADRHDGAESSGAAYLSSRRLHYRASDRSACTQNEAIESLCEALAEVFARRKVELPPAGAVPLSVYFLVPHGLVARFRDVVRSYRAAGDVRLLLSGPWPPYNFAD